LQFCSSLWLHDCSGNQSFFCAVIDVHFAFLPACPQVSKQANVTELFETMNCWRFDCILSANKIPSDDQNTDFFCLCSKLARVFAVKLVHAGNSAFHECTDS
jgi:hypothetical protein